MTLESGNVAMVLVEPDPHSDRLAVASRMQHLMDIKELREKYYANVDEVRRREKEYKSYLQYTVPPRKGDQGRRGRPRKGQGG